MLNRSLFEGAVVAWWMHLHSDPAGLVETLRRHGDHSRVLWDRAAKMHPELDLETTVQTEPLAEAYVAELDGQFKRFGSQWHGKRLDELVQEVEDGWGEPYQGLLWKLFRFVNVWNNTMLHHSSMSVAEAIDWPVGGDPSLRMGPDRRWGVATLWAAHMSYALTVMCTLRKLSPDRAEGFWILVDELMPRYRTVTAEDVRGLTRNDACPCGSGKKLKYCHEGRVAA